MIGQRKLQEYYKTHPGKGLFHKIHYSDEAYICLVIRNNQDMWIHQYREKEAKGRNSSSPQKSNKNRKRSRSNSKNKGIDTESDTLLDATVSPRPLWTGFKTGSKISYLASGWSEDGEQFFQMMEKYIKKRTDDETAELHKIWDEHFGKQIRMLQQREYESLPAIRTSDDECVSVPEVDFETDSDNDDLESIRGHITEGGDEGECRDGMEGDADDLVLTPV